MTDIKISASGYAAISAAAKAEGVPVEDSAALRSLSRAATSFREFLNHWHFLDKDTGTVRVLGECLWPGQEEFVATAESHSWIFYLKARQLGETTIACAFDAWVARFRDQNARVHVFSKKEKDAQGLLYQVKYGLERLPDAWQLDSLVDNLNEYVLDAGSGDERKIEAFPANRDTSRGDTCTHAHIDEWAFMENPARVWQSIEPSAAGSLHIVTTEIGPMTPTAQFWRRCVAGDVLDRQMNPIYACFIGVLGSRPLYTREYLESKRKSMSEEMFNREYPRRWEDALSSGGDNKFKSTDVDKCGKDYLGLMRPETGRRYVNAWDIGRHKDAAVGTTLLLSRDGCIDVVGYWRLREQPYPFIQAKIEEVDANYRGINVIEVNAAGEAVLENLKIPDERLVRWSTSRPSKALAIENLVVLVQNWIIKWDPVACSQLDGEIRGYMIPDEHIVQDSVMSLAIGCKHIDELATGQVRGILSW